MSFGHKNERVKAALGNNRFRFRNHSNLINALGGSHKHINAMCGQNAEYTNVKPGGTHKATKL